MADYLSINEFAGTGAVMTVDIQFAGNDPDVGSGAVPYFKVADVKAVIVTPATSISAPVEVPVALVYVGPTTFKTATAVPVGKTLRVYRETENKYGLVNFVALQNVTENDLDTLSRQTLFVVEEALDNGYLSRRLAQLASEAAAAATVTSNSALGLANAATSVANAAQGSAAAAVTTANTAATNASQALAAANSAEAHATNVETLAAAAVSTANAASTAAGQATVTANSAASVAAGIDAKATTAQTQAAAAVQTANNAASTAAGIDAKASNALSSAGNAVTVANQAKATADGVDAKASQAQTDSAAALAASQTATTAASNAAPKSGAILTNASANVDPGTSDSSLNFATTSWVRKILKLFGISLGTGEGAQTVTNCNTALTTGTYSVPAGSTGTPVTVAGILEVYKADTNAYGQRFHVLSTGELWFRTTTNTGTTWYAWGKIVYSVGGGTAVANLLELGDNASTSILDMHAVGGNADYDVRVSADQGVAGTAGQGRLVIAGKVRVSGETDAAGSVYSSERLSMLGNGVMSLRTGDSTNAANLHHWFYDYNGSERGLCYCDNTGAFRWRAKGAATNWTVGANGDCTARLGIYAGAAIQAGSAIFATDGNLYGTAWGGWLSNNLNANFVARGNLAGDIATYASATGIVGTYAMCQVTGTTVTAGQQILGSNLRYSSHNAGTANAPVGTWVCMGNGNNGGVSLFLRVA